MEHKKEDRTRKENTDRHNEIPCYKLILEENLIYQLNECQFSFVGRELGFGVLFTYGLGGLCYVVLVGWAHVKALRKRLKVFHFHLSISLFFLFYFLLLMLMIHKGDILSIQLIESSIQLFEIVMFNVIIWNLF